MIAISKNLRITFTALIIFLFSGLLTEGYARKNDIRFEHISVEQGLPQNSIHCILQDAQGFMWFGTWDGLSQYDGYSFTTIKNDPANPDSLSHNSVRCLYEDRSGNFWIGTENGGLNRFDRERDKFIRYQNISDDPQSLSHNNVRAICEDREGLLWIGTEEGLNRFDRKTGKFTRYQHDPEDPYSLSHNNVRAVCEDRFGTLWTGTEGGGLNRFDRNTGKFIRYLYDPEGPNSLSHNNVRSVCNDHEGILWVGTENGLNRLDREKDQFVRYLYHPDDPGSMSHNGIWTVYEDPYNDLWIGTEGGGLNQFDRKKNQFVRYRHNDDDPHSLSHDVIWSVYGDSSGVIWVGTYTGGLNLYDREKEPFVCYKNDPENSNSLSHNVVWSIYEDDDGILWLGTDGGLNRLDREKEEVVRYRNIPEDPDSLSHNEVWSVCGDIEGRLWVGTYGGLNRFDPKSGKFVSYRLGSDTLNNTIKTLYKDHEGILWIGAKGGLNRFDPETGQFLRYQNIPGDSRSLSHNVVWSICEDSDKVLWVGAESGLNRFDRKTGQFIRYLSDPKNPRSLSDNWILSLYEDRRGNLWVGTLSGLNRFDKIQETVLQYREKDGLPNEMIYGILEDRQGYLWISSNKGLSRFDSAAGIFRNYDVRDGLQSNEFNVGAAFRSASGEMFFGGIMGFNAFYPDKIKNNPYLPRIVLTDFQVFNESVKAGKDSPLTESVSYTQAIRLSYKESVFSFEFAALHYAAAKKNQYAYKMEGFDADWIYSGTRRFITYTNLPAGNYVLRVKGSNNDGVWNEKGASVNITITPPLWKTWWAYTLYGLFLTVALFEYVRYKTKAQAAELQQKHKELEQKRIAAEELERKVEERTQELNETLKKVKAANTHIMDSLRYAQMIQSSLLPNADEVKTYLPHSFFLWMPRDVVGGDIFFTDSFEDGFIAAVIDCTGHGVPGAFLTMIASSGMRRIVKDENCHDPAMILKQLNGIVKSTLQQDMKYAISDDGLDAAVCFVRPKEGILTFAGAKLPLFYVLNGKAALIKGDMQSIGYKRADLNFDFSDHTVKIEQGMCFYMASDGFQDQLGRDDSSRFNVRRFGKKRFMSLLENVSRLPFEEQRESFLETFHIFKGDNERQDDVTVIGFGFRFGSEGMDFD